MKVYRVKPVRSCYNKNFFREEKGELSEMAYKLKKGLNENEVIIIPKNIENFADMPVTIWGFLSTLLLPLIVSFLVA